MFTLLLQFEARLGGGWAPAYRCLFTTSRLGTAPAESSIRSPAPYSKSPRIQISRWYFALWLFHTVHTLCSTNQHNRTDSQMQLPQHLPPGSQVPFGCFVTWIPPCPRKQCPPLVHTWWGQPPAAGPGVSTRHFYQQVHCPSHPSEDNTLKYCQKAQRMCQTLLGIKYLPPMNRVTSVLGKNKREKKDKEELQHNFKGTVWGESLSTEKM